MEKEAVLQTAPEIPAAGRREKNTRFDEKHIDVLDGIRALAVLGVLWFHFWQQNWISPYFKLPFLTSLGLSASVSLDFLPRAGFLFVDLLLFLSAFCLFLPYVRAPSTARRCRRRDSSIKSASPASCRATISRCS
jgi:peptidoglycan/LPS O-acetylase OafA/YrhL